MLVNYGRNCLYISILFKIQRMRRIFSKTQIKNKIKFHLKTLKEFCFIFNIISSNIQF